MVLAGNKAKRLSSVNHTTKTIHHHHNNPFDFRSKTLLPLIGVSKVKKTYAVVGILTDFVIHHQQKNSCQNNTLDQALLPFLFLYFLAHCETAILSLFTGKFGCFNFVSNTDNVNLL